MGLLSGLMKSLAGRASAAATPEAAATRTEVPADDWSAAVLADLAAGRLAAAHARTRARIDADPADGRAWHLRASTLMHWGRTREALVAFRRAQECDPSSTPIALGLGVAAWEAGACDEAERALRAGLGADPASADVGLALARMLLASGRIDEARRLATSVHDRDASNAAALLALARCDRRAGRAADAERRIREAIAIDDADPHAWGMLSSAAADGDRLDEASAALDRAQALVEAGGAALDLSAARAELDRRRGDFAGMTRVLVEALHARPDPAGHFMLSEALIVQGRWREGWRQFEFRKLDASVRGEGRHPSRPAWSGQDLAGTTIMVEAEQGIGDVVMFARFLPPLQRMGARVVFLPRIDMVGISRRFPGVDHGLAEGEALPPHDFRVKLLSLPHVLGTRIDTLPAEVPYLTADPARAERWRDRLPATSRPRIGIVWAGKPAQARDRFRSLELRQLLPVLRVPGIEFCSLQKGPAEEQLATLPDDVRVTPLGVAFDDLEDLLAAIARMDLVVTVCTGPAHIAGAMGVPVWTMICDPPDMRWLAGRDDSPWYPTMRLFRQRTPGRWSDVIERVAGELARGPGAWKDLARLPARPPLPSRGTPLTAQVRDDVDAGLARLAETRWGALMIDGADATASLSLEHYGEWLPAMLDAAARLARPGAVVVEAGAGIGAHTIPLARQVGADGLVLAFEANALRHRLLALNLGFDRLVQATPMPRIPTGPDAAGRAADRETIDDLQLDRLDGLKANDGADAAAIVEGAQETLWRCRPWMMLAADDDESLARLAARVREFGYRTWRMETPYFPPSNFNRRGDDIFGGRTALALIALPEEADLREPPAGCVELR
ncbi:hypothetical protein BURK1_01822 [Burkholderiales bacterium]|nr:hypothetical protein BURK1_01822 [Burkholderiales bacterium]